MKLLLATTTNNKTMAAYTGRLFLITQNRTRHTKRSLETMKGDIS